MVANFTYPRTNRDLERYSFYNCISFIHDTKFRKLESNLERMAKYLKIINRFVLKRHQTQFCESKMNMKIGLMKQPLKSQDRTCFMYLWRGWKKVYLLNLAGFFNLNMVINQDGKNLNLNVKPASKLIPCCILLTWRGWVNTYSLDRIWEKSFLI